MKRAFLYDTWAFMALADRRDSGHSVAREIDLALESAGFSAVTTDYVIDETLTLIQSMVGAHASLAFMDELAERLVSSELTLVEIRGVRRTAAFEVFRRLAPAEPRLSFTDTTSFAVMAELGIELAFTADRHFHRAGSGILPLVERKGARLVARDVPFV
jgi:predicted nucleic acid-binding protein